MSKPFSRRRFLGTALAASVLPIFTEGTRGASPASKRLSRERAYWRVNGRPASLQTDRSRLGVPALALLRVNDFVWSSLTNRGHASSSTGMGSFHLGRRMAFPAGDPSGHKRRG